MVDPQGRWRPQNPNRIGTVVDERITRWNGIRVFWEGTKNPQYCNVDNLKKVR